MNMSPIGFADDVGSWLGRRHGLPPATGRVLGWLMVCEPAAQTHAQLSQALGLSRSSVGTAVTLLENMSLVQRSRPSGVRSDQINFDPEGGAKNLDDVQQYVDQAAIARRGLAVLSGSSIERQAILLETAAFYDFVAERTPQLAAEWRAKRDLLRESGDLPHGSKRSDSRSSE